MAKLRTRSDSPTIAVLVSVVGGALDAYTLILHGVFANAQSGNLVLIAANVAQLHWADAGRQVPAVVAFVLGLVTAEALSLPWARRMLRRPTRVVLVLEVLMLAVVGALPDTASAYVVTAVIAYVAAVQVNTFSSIGGYSYTTTMATGNLRNVVAAAFGVLTGHSEDRRAMRLLATAISGFIAGAFLGALATVLLGARAAWPVAALLVVVLVMIVAETREYERPPAS